MQILQGFRDYEIPYFCGIITLFFCFPAGIYLPLYLCYTGGIIGFKGGIKEKMKRPENLYEYDGYKIPEYDPTIPPDERAR